MSKCRFLAFVLLPTLLTAADALQPIPLRQVKVQGEIGRRIDITLRNNVLALDADRDFLAPFQKKQAKGGYIGLGKLMMATSRLAAYSNDPKALALRQHLLDAALKIQEPDGYPGMFEPGSRMNALWDIHENGYMVAAFLTDYELFGDQRALAAARRAADYLVSNWQRLPANWQEKEEVAPHVAVTGLERTLLAMHRVTGDARYVDFVRKQRALAEWDLPVVVGRRQGIEGHIYAFMARALAQLELFRLQPEPRLLGQSQRALDFLTTHDGMAVTGGAGQWEIWTDDQDGRGQLAETCATTYQIRVYESLLRLHGDARMGDLMERTIFNSLFAAQSPDGRKIRYYSPTEGPREYHPGDTYCCPGNYRRFVAELPEMIYYRHGKGVAVNLYSASEAKLELAGTSVTLRQTTQYPSELSVRLQIQPGAPAAFPLALRIPAWATGTVIFVNESKQPAPRPGAFAVIDRTWRPGDEVRIEFGPAAPRLVAGRQRQAGRTAVLYGPLVFCLNPAQNPALAGKDAADLGRFTIDPASLKIVPDQSVRPGGVAVRANAWKPGYSTSPKPDLTLQLTEFPDPNGQATYFRLRNPADARDDELHVKPGRR